MGQNNKIIQDQKENIDELLEPKYISENEATFEFKINRQFDLIDLKDNLIFIKHRNQLAIWNCKEKNRKSSYYFMKEIQLFCMSNDNNFLVCMLKDGKQFQIMHHKTKKINHNINSPSSLIKFTKDNKIILVNYYYLYILNFPDENLLICNCGQVSYLTFDYCPINSIVILPIKENIQVWNVNNGEKIIQKDKQVQMTGDVIIQISQSGDQFLLNSEQTGQLKIYDIDLRGKQLICVKNIKCPLKMLNISWIQEDCYIILDDGYAFIIIQADINQPIIGKYQKQQNTIPPWLVYVNQRYTLLRQRTLDYIVALRLSSIDIYSIKL
ncbi:hypothetical protein pb186bvf_004796 [Paramecium bursaria]